MWGQCIVRERERTGMVLHVREKPSRPGHELGHAVRATGAREGVWRKARSRSPSGPAWVGRAGGKEKGGRGGTAGPQAGQRGKEEKEKGQADS